MSNGHDLPLSQSTRLNELLAEHRISVRKLARTLAGSDAQKDLERERRNITRWRGGKGISDHNALRLVEAFRSFEVILPSDYFKKRRGARTWQQAMEVRMLAMQIEIEDLRRRLGA